MEKQLLSINDEPVVHEYMEMLFDHDKKDEYDQTKELIEYIAGMEKQFEEVTRELHDVKELLNNLQNPATKSRLSTVVDKTLTAINTGKNRLDQLKLNVVSSMKDCLASFKQKGKDGVIKTINIFHFKEALGGIRKSLFIAMNKTNHLVQTCDAVTSEMRNAKRNLRNVGRLILGRPVQKDTADKSKLNMMQKSTRSMLSVFKSMATKTTNMLHKIEDFEKPSVKSEIKLLRNSTKSKNLKVHEKKEQSR